MSETLLVAEEVTKRFGQVVALDAFSVTIEDGQRVAVVGPNGAGKTTFFNCVTGVERPSAGKLHFRGRDIRNASPHVRARRGIGRTFQNLRLFGQLTVLENVLVSDWSSGRRNRDGRRHRDAVIAAADHLASVHPELLQRRNEPASSLPYGMQKHLELARALMSRPRLLLLDEPAAGLNAVEKEGFLERLREACGSDVALLVVEHDLRFVSSIADRMIVLDSGVCIADGPPARVTKDPAVVDAYLGPTGTP